MFNHDRVGKVLESMKKNGADALVIGPSADLEYLTGLKLHADERFSALFLFNDGKYFYISPQLSLEEIRNALGEKADIYDWGDSEGFMSALLKANEKYSLVSKQVAINDAIRAVDLIDMGIKISCHFINGISIMENVRAIKTKEERNNMKIAGEIADKAFTEIIKWIKPGLTEKQIKNKLEELMMENGAMGMSFEPIVASGPNSSKPHYCDDARIIEENDLMVLDFGCKYNGYCSDTSRMVFVGEPTDEMKKVYDIVLKAHLAGEAAARAGVPAQSADRAARKIITDAGYGQCFINRTGHGIGTAVHETPDIKEGNMTILEDGMAFSIEPGIYIPGKFGMRVEDIMIIDDGKGVSLNHSTKEMVVIK